MPLNVGQRRGFAIEAQRDGRLRAVGVCPLGRSDLRYSGHSP